ncbi:type I restriction-modification system, specificity subunit S [Lacticaseibacillus paracasei]|nr:type I restriction-modification system, specificity subunit S [Lacticaseibacillus paracasei]
MSKDAKNVPALRFKGYSDAWEKRKFKNLVVRVNKTSDNSTIPSVEFEDIISKQGRLNKDVRLKVNSKQGIYFEPQDVLFGKLRPYLQNWLFPSFYGRAVGDFWVLRANSSLLSEYLFVLIQSPRFQSVANISSGTKMPRSDWNTVSNTSFSIPVQSEQRRIEQLFNVLDDLIAATQHKIDALEQAKKVLLQRLFDQSWRFKDYSDPWEKRKLGEVADIVGGGTPSTSRPEYWNGEIDWYAPAEIGTQRYVYKSRRQITELGLEKSSAVMLPANKTILFTSRAGIGNAAILTSPATTNQGFQSMIVNSNTDTYFYIAKFLT